ncbi:LytR family transcriptional regulator [Streptomyces sp. NWU49]|uniref:LCP family protein n=1 Tax=Streptomyces sp. NWU49 TaxID=2201153 RepID=UPI000D67939D|nr:LCP family protein [Streptomyces sp. NWU49]PWJ03416.1 LytR family transcriptional regulator [Streptomyces sp. NWU49]
MDAPGRGRSEGMDPADQWVLNPDTGEYELRSGPSAPRSAVPGPRRSAPPGTDGAAGARTRIPGRAVPPPRGRRGAPDDGRRGRRPAQRKPRAKRALLWTGGTMAFVVLATGAGGCLYLEHLEGNVTTTDVGGAGRGDFRRDEAFNILVIGTDKRTGKGNEGYGDKNSAGHADTTVLLHVSEDRSNATALSIPRDLIVDIPDCPTRQEDGTEKVVPGLQGVRFNRSLGEAGRDPGCTMLTVEQATGIPVDHFMMADFNAVKTLTTAVDGIPVCLEHPVDDEESKLRLPAGESTVEGEQALAFVRTRHSFGNQGDLDRIKVQQHFLASLMRKMSSSDTLTSPAKLVKLAEAATKALTVDTGIGRVSTLKDVALELKKVPPKNISFTTVPVKDNPAEKIKATVVLDESKAPRLFEAIRNDVSLTEVKRRKKKEKDAVAARLKGEKAPASEVRVQVLNGGAPSGSAQETLRWLQVEQGVTKSENAGNADEDLKKTTLEYAPDQAAQARRLADILGLSGSAMKPGGSVTNFQGLPAMTLILGEDFKGAGIPLTPPDRAPDDIEKSTADKVECAS